MKVLNETLIERLNGDDFVEIAETVLYKYRLHELFVAYYGMLAAEKKKQLAREFKVAYGCVLADCAILMVDTRCIPRKRLKRYAELFGVTIEELRTKIHTKTRNNGIKNADTANH